MSAKDATSFPGMPGRLARAAHWLRTRTQVLPPVAVGVGVGMGLGCGIGWPIRRAYGPPRAVCGPAVGVGVGIGYGQGFGRRFGSDTRHESFLTVLGRVERGIDTLVHRIGEGFRRVWRGRAPSAE